MSQVKKQLAQYFLHNGSISILEFDKYKKKKLKQRRKCAKEQYFAHSGCISKLTVFLAEQYFCDKGGISMITMIPMK